MQSLRHLILKIVYTIRKNILDKVDKSRKDWYKLLKENNIDYYKLKEYLKSDKFINEVGEVIDDNNKTYFLDESPIHGKGIFASYDISKGLVIGIGYFNNNRTILGRYINHSPFNNAKFYYKDQDVILLAEKDIVKGEEILVNYREHLLNKSFI